MPGKRSDKNTTPHLLTIAVEDYFHATAVRQWIRGHHQRRLVAHLAANVERALALLDEFDIKATFFVLGCVAETHPHIVRAIVAAGHEVAARPWEHRAISDFDRDSFRADARRSRAALEQAAGAPVRGYRIAEQRFRSTDYWALDVLSEAGFIYDSSIYPRFRELRAEPWRRFPHVQATPHGDIIEFPLSSWGPDWFLLPLAGGNAIRQMPAALVRGAVAAWTARHAHPFNMYFNIWELDPELPRLAFCGPFTRLRQYRNLERMPHLLRHFFQKYRFEGVYNHLERWAISPPPALPAVAPAAAPIELTPASAAPTECDAADLPPFTVVVPCFNEQAVLPYTQRTLAELESRLAPPPATVCVRR